jgi:hypothetical protein
MSKYTETLKAAMAKKHAAEHPDVKSNTKQAAKPVSTAPKGPPIRKAASRGG